MSDTTAAGGPGERRGFHVYLSREAYDGWARMSERTGASMTALAEVIGIRFAADGGSLSDDEVERALQVDRDRRARRR